MVGFKTRKKDGRVFPTKGSEVKSETNPRIIQPLQNISGRIIKKGFPRTHDSHLSKRDNTKNPNNNNNKEIRIVRESKALKSKFRAAFIKDRKSGLSLKQASIKLTKRSIIRGRKERKERAKKLVEKMIKKNPKLKKLFKNNPNGNPNGVKRTRNILITLVGLSIALTLLRQFKFASGSNRTIKGKGSFRVTKLEGGFKRTETKMIGKRKAKRFRFVQPNPKTKIRLGFVEAGKPGPTGDVVTEVAVFRRK